MSQENVEIVRRSIDAFGRGDLEGVLDDLAPEFEFHPSGRFMDTQKVYRGRDSFVDFWGRFRGAWEDIPRRATLYMDVSEALKAAGLSE